MKYLLPCSVLIAGAAILPAHSVKAQLIPQPWVSVGSRESEVTYSLGARALNLGVELGHGTEDSSGVDALAFIDLPFISRISPYVGLGVYSDDQGLAVSGGVQVNPDRHLILGVGYHSIRGFNGQLGVRF